MFSDNLPQKFSEFIIHKKIVENLQKKNYNNMGNLLFHGINNNGKKHLINTLLKHIFNENINKVSRTSDIKINNNIIKINYYQSKYHYEINLFEYGLYDKNIITEFLKEIVSTTNVNNNTYKVIILHKIDRTNELAQLTLRRIIEIYSNNCRFIVTVENLSKINKALISRFETIRVPFAEESEIIKYIDYSNNKFNLNLSKENISNILKIDKNTDNLITINYALFHNKGYSKKIFDICITFDTIIKQENIFFMDKLRKYIYKLHLLNYKFTDIIKLYLKYVIKNNIYPDSIYKIINESALCEHECVISKRYFFALEKFFIFIKKINTNNN